MTEIPLRRHQLELAPKFAVGLLNRSSAVQWGTAAVTVALVLSPIVPIVYQSLIDRPIYDAGHQLTMGNYVNLFRSPALRQALINTFVLAVASTLIAQVLGALFAVLLGRTDLPGRRLLGDVMLWPLFISSLVLAFGWFMIYGPAGYVTMLVGSVVGGQPWNLYSMGGMALVAGISHMPMTLLYCLGSTALANPVLEDAARTCGASGQGTDHRSVERCVCR